jgi:cytochrome c oxidase assembly factor CtaG
MAEHMMLGAIGTVVLLLGAAVKAWGDGKPATRAPKLHQVAWLT